jgi:hypothetical protein
VESLEVILLVQECNVEIAAHLLEPCIHPFLERELVACVFLMVPWKDGGTLPCEDTKTARRKETMIAMDGVKMV